MAEVGLFPPSPPPPPRQHQHHPPPPPQEHPKPTQTDTTPSPSAPTQERRPIRRRKKLRGESPQREQQDPPSSILIPPHIQLPITIQFLFVPPNSPPREYQHKIQNLPHVFKTTPLFSYFEGETNRPIRDINPFKGKSSTTTGQDERSKPVIDAADAVPDLKTFESPVKGEVIEWCISEGQILRESDGWRTRPLVKIKEPCTHSVQWHGQCAICGCDLTIADYTGISETSRASIPMSHGPSSLTVSVSEAQRLESETRSRLLKSRKLSLIVDLDQTIVHATVDPTVGEWMSDPSNPNWSALQDVSQFRLTDAPNLSYEGCYYYLKQRPGLSAFLHSLADQYEMHVYTMGTRAYADAVCKIIDPTGEIFASRILSRDESGSMTLKSISRLFPVDTSMVVIIDDRGDVWEYSPNLVSVVPYNFFVGIGDINGAFLPPARQLEAPSVEFNHSSSQSTDGKGEDAPIPTMTVTDHSQPSSTAQSAPSVESKLPHSNEPLPASSLSESVVSAQGTAQESMPSSPSSSQAASSSGEATQQNVENTARSKLIADQVLTRPLKQKQMALQEAQRAQKIDSRKRNSSSSGTVPMSSQGSSNSSSSTVNSSRTTTPVATNPPPPPVISPSSSNTPPPLQNPTGAYQDTVASSLNSLASQEVTVDSKSNTQLPATSQTVTSAPGEDASDSTTDISLMDEIDDEVPERPVLVDKDTELNRLGSILSDIHTGFFSQDSIDQADAREVILALKNDVLRGVHIAFSSLWPMDAICEQQNLWKLAEQFGACCYTSLSPRVTHLIAAKLGTYKVNTALSRPNVAVLRPKWLLDAVTLWTRPPEEEYSWRSGVTTTPNSLTNSTEDEGDFEGDWGAGMNPTDWNEARAEVMAALDESDDETTNASVVEGGNYSSDEGDEERGRSRKRGRTSTANSGSSSTFARSRESSHTRTVSTETLFLEDSPLSKRKRMARSRSSKLKLVVAATDLDEESNTNLEFNHHHRSTSIDPSSSSKNNHDDKNRGGAEDNNNHSLFTTDGIEFLPLPDLSAEEDEFLSALAAEMEDNLSSNSC